MEFDEFVNITSKHFFSKQRYTGLVETILDFFSFEEKLLIMNLNQKIKNCILKKTRFIKVRNKIYRPFNKIY
jgi:hypothetical protein